MYRAARADSANLLQQVRTLENQRVSDRERHAQRLHDVDAKLHMLKEHNRQLAERLSLLQEEHEAEVCFHS